MGLGDVTLKTVMEVRQGFEEHLSRQGALLLVSLCGSLGIASL